jgi:hypothetical protein
MKNFRIIFLVFCALAASGCSTNKEDDSDNNLDTSSTAVNTVLTEDEKIEKVINDAMTRLRYRDKSYIYDMEFQYYKDEHTFDDYLKERQILMAKADTLEYVDVVSAEYFGDDSAIATVEVHFKGPTGVESVLKQPGTVFYKRDGEWIKPTLSKIDKQLQYDAIREEAQKSAKSETGK